MTNESLIAEHAALLAQVDLFAGLTRVTLAKLAAHLVPVKLPSGAELFHQGYGVFSLLALTASVFFWDLMGLL
jgi:hypothetical protein